MSKLLDALQNPDFREIAETNVSSFIVNALPEDIQKDSTDSYYFDIKVERKAHGRWAVLHNGDAYNIKGKREYEPLPSSRTESWKKRFRFDLLTAIELAEKISHEVKLMSWTAETFAEEYRNRKKNKTELAN